MQRWGPEVQTPGSRGPPGLCSSAFLSLEQALPEALPPARPGCPQEPRGRERLPWLRHPPQGPPRDTPWTRSSVQEATASCWVDPRVVNASTLSLNSRISWSVTGVGVPLAVCAVWGPGYAGWPPSGFPGVRFIPPSVRPRHWGVPTPKRSCGSCLYSHSVGSSALPALKQPPLPQGWAGLTGGALEARPRDGQGQ